MGVSLKTLGYFGDHRASVQVVKDGDTYAVRFVTVDSAWTDPEMKETFALVGYALNQSALPGKNMRIELCDDSFDTQATIQPKAPPEELPAESAESPASSEAPLEPAAK